MESDRTHWSETAGYTPDTSIVSAFHGLKNEMTNNTISIADFARKLSRRCLSAEIHPRLLPKTASGL